MHRHLFALEFRRETHKRNDCIRLSGCRDCLLPQRFERWHPIERNARPEKLGTMRVVQLERVRLRVCKMQLERRRGAGAGFVFLVRRVCRYLLAVEVDREALVIGTGIALGQRDGERVIAGCRRCQGSTPSHCKGMRGHTRYRARGVPIEVDLRVHPGNERSSPEIRRRKIFSLKTHLIRTRRGVEQRARRGQHDPFRIRRSLRV